MRSSIGLTNPIGCDAAKFGWLGDCKKSDGVSRSLSEPHITENGRPVFVGISSRDIAFKISSNVVTPAYTNAGDISFTLNRSINSEFVAFSS